MSDTTTLASTDERIAIANRMVADTTAVLGAMDIVFGECDR